MPITPIVPPQPIDPPSIAPIEPPSPQGGRDGALRVVVWFRSDLALPDDDIACTPGAADVLFGPGVAQRLLITPETAWLQRLLPGALAAAIDEAVGRGGTEDVVRSTPYSHIYLFRLTGGLGLRHVCDVLGASANVRLVYPEPTFTVAAVPTLYKTGTVFSNEQTYLKATQGINAEAAWAKGHTGAGVQAAVVDAPADFSGLPFNPRVVPPPPAPKGSGSAATPPANSVHARLTAGILGSPDHAAFGIGAAPEVSLVFAAVPIGSTTTLASVAGVFGNLLANGKLAPGDVVNASIAVNAGLDVQQPYAGYAALMQQMSTGPHRPVTEKVVAEERPSGVMTDLPLEFEPTLLKAIADFTAKGITVVEAAGNGLRVLCKPTTGGKEVWVMPKLGADLAGAWRRATPEPTVAKFKQGLAAKPTHSLDRGAKTGFDDGGGIIVGGGQFSLKSAGMIDNIQLNHGNRVDCYVNTPSGQNLGFTLASAANIGGTSLCAPAIAGAVAVVQGIVKAQFKGALQPAIVRALLSDPTLGIPTVAGSPVGVMPDLALLMALLEKPQGKRDDLLKAVQAQQQASATRVKAASATPSAFVHDPYTRFTKANGWQPLAIASASDLFTP